ncbi:MAG: hypothetical protein MHPSP_004233, partial [Paramarteilia canceri]
TKLEVGMNILISALESIPKILLKNAGFDSFSVLLESKALTDKSAKNMGVNLSNGHLVDMIERKVYDSYSVKKNMLQASSMLVENFLSIDTIIKSTPEGFKKNE